MKMQIYKLDKKSQVRFRKILICSVILIGILSLYFVFANSIPLTNTIYTGDYIILSKSGNESLYDVTIVKDERTGFSTICLEAGWDIKEVEIYKFDEKTGEEVLDYRYNYSVPSALSFYKTEKLEKQGDLTKTKADQLSATSPANPNKFCYEADPKKDFYLKFGDNSVIVIQNGQVTTQSNLVNVTAEVNFTHLNISTSALYNSLVGYWNFDGDKENTKLTKHYDWSKNNNDGTGVGDVTVNNTNCIYGDCARFDGNGDGIYMGNVLNFGTIDFTVSYWINYSNSARIERPIMKRSGCTSNTFWEVLHWTDGDIGFYTYSDINGDCSISTTKTYTIGAWHNIVAVRNSTNILIYVDGIMNATSSCSPARNVTNTTNFLIGDSVCTNADLTGPIDEIMIFNTSLTSAQILAIYNNQSSRFAVSGKQEIYNQTYMNITSGNNRVNVTTYIENLLGSNINLSIGYYNVTGWFYTAPQVVSSGVVSIFNISSTSTNLTLNYTFYAGNSTNPFYSPIIKENITFTVWSTMGTNVTSCGVLDRANTIYNLQSDLSTTGTCLIVEANNVTINLNGYSITGDDGAGDYGIYSKYNDTKIKNGSIYDFWYGIYLENNQNNNINNITANSNWDGIYFKSSHNNSITNNIANLNTDIGIFLWLSSNNTLTNNTANSDSNYGIYLYLSHNNTVQSSTITASTSNGISLYSSSNNTLRGNIINNSMYGINLDSSSNNQLINNTANSNSFYGIILSSSSNNHIENNTINSNFRAGIFLSLSNNTILTNNNIWNCSTIGGYACIDIGNSNYNVFDGNKINKSSSYGIKVYSYYSGYSSSHNLFKNTNMTNIEGTSVVLNTTYGLGGYSYNLNNTFLNFSYTSESVDSNSEFIRKWYYRAYVNDTSGLNVSGVNVTAYNTTGNYNFNLTTDSTGYTQLGEIIDYVNIDGTKTYYSNYSIYADKPCYPSYRNYYNITKEQNNLKHVLTLGSSTYQTWNWNFADNCVLANKTYNINGYNITSYNTGNWTLANVNITCSNFDINSTDTWIIITNKVKIIGS